VICPAYNFSVATIQSAPPPPRSAPPPRPTWRDRLDYFWQRVTEGMELEQLWSQFRAEATHAYRFYADEVEAKNIDRSQRHAWWEIAKEFFWATLTKLSPVRRLVLLVALVLLVIPSFSFVSDRTRVSFESYPVWGGILLLVLLLAEVSDRVTMKRDLQIAREIQSWLVPAEAPRIPGLDIAFVTRPANTVAGDYYDAFPLPDNGSGRRVLVTVADVAGKSIPAALLMATYQASLQTLSAIPCSLSELTAGMNRYASAHSSGGRRFTTAFLAEINTDTGAMTFVNAGHNAPVLRRANGSIERLQATGLPLGITAEGGYECGSRQLARGDLLVIFTDGLVEAVNVRGQEYEEPRMLTMLQGPPDSPAADVLKRLMLDVDLFVGAARQHDDITCLLVRIT